MNKNILLFLKGMLIGLGKIIPGVSGGIIAMSLGVYEKMITSITQILQNFKQNFTFLLVIGSGILISIALGSKIIIFFLTNYYLPTMLLFIGLILGGTPALLKIAKEKITKSNIVIMLIPVIILLLLSFLVREMSIKMSLNIFTIFLVGIIDALTMIIPGISGTAIMMMLGVYENIMISFTSFNHLNILIPFLFGVGTGVMIFAKLIEQLLKKYRISCYWAVIGFMITTIILLINQTFRGSYSVYEIIFGLIFMIIGYFLGKIMQ